MENLKNDFFENKIQKKQEKLFDEMIFFSKSSSVKKPKGLQTKICSDRQVSNR